MINFKKIINFTLLFFTLTSNLISYPCYYTRFYNEQTGQTLDIIGDCHKENDMAIYPETCGILLDILSQVDRDSTNIIWESNPTISAQEEGRDNRFIRMTSSILRELYDETFIAADTRPIFDFNFYFVKNYLSLSIEELTRKARQENIDPNSKVLSQLETLFPIRSITSETSWFDMSRLSPERQEILQKERAVFKREIQHFLCHPFLGKTLIEFSALVDRFSTQEDGRIKFTNKCFEKMYNDFFYKYQSICIYKIFDFDLLKNIFSSQKQQIIICAGQTHCEQISKFLKTNNLGFREIFEYPMQINSNQEPIPLPADLWVKIQENPREQLARQAIEIQAHHD